MFLVKHASCLLSRPMAWLCIVGLLLARATPDLRAVPEIRLQGGNTPGGLLIDFTDQTNTPWVLQSSTDLVTWNNVRSFQIHNTRYRFTVDATSAGPQVFFRIVSADDTPVEDSRSARTTLPATPANYAVFNLPAHLLTSAIQLQNNTPATNPVTNIGATLGRVLFYDRRLSRNNQVACASCHHQEQGFADPRPLSIGFAGASTRRNAMGLTSARYYTRGKFLWDERGATLEQQVLFPIQDTVEMGLTLPELTVKLAAESYYRELFASAFGDPAITSERIGLALAQFIRSLVSSSTKFDVGVATNFSNLTAAENRGRVLFKSCSVCHTSNNFVLSSPTNNGLEFPFVDLGLGGVTGLATDNGKFKAPSLRNIALTAPYMHDGRFATLEEVVQFYSTGVVTNPNLGRLSRLNLTSTEISDLVAFLNTLTDTALTSDPRFADPFKTGETLTLP
jgi:cytochrome c peroxidase